MSVPITKEKLSAWLDEALAFGPLDCIVLSNEDVLAVESEVYYAEADDKPCMTYRGIRCHASYSIVVGRPLAVPRW